MVEPNEENFLGILLAILCFIHIFCILGEDINAFYSMTRMVSRLSAKHSSLFVGFPACTRSSSISWGLLRSSASSWSSLWTCSSASYSPSSRNCFEGKIRHRTLRMRPYIAFWTTLAFVYPVASNIANCVLYDAFAWYF